MSRLSSVEWELAIITAIILVVPAGMVFAEGVFSAEEESESYFRPEKTENFHNPDTSKTYINTNNNLRNDAGYAYSTYAYENDTGEGNAIRNEGLYTINQTGNPYNEFLAQQDSDDNGEFAKFYGLTFGLNQTLDDAISEDLNKVQFSAEFLREGNFTLGLYAGAIEDSEEYQYKLAEGSFDSSTNTSDYSLEIDFSKILDADSQLGEYDNQLSLIIEGDDDLIQPGDSLKFNIDLMSSYTVSPLITTNFFAGLVGGLSLLAGVFTSPWIDFRDVYGPLLGAIK